MIKRGILIIVVLGVLAVSLSAQSYARTIEEYYLQNTDMMVLREQAIHPDREMKMLALEGVGDLLDAGGVETGDIGIHYILDHLANEGLSVRVKENNRLINNHPLVRMQACTLLGRLGGANSRATLLKLLHEESEPLVKAEAIQQLGFMAIEDDGEASKIILEAIRSQNITNPSDNLAYAGLVAIESFADAGIAPDRNALRMVITIARGNYNQVVRTKAGELLEKLRKR